MMEKEKSNLTENLLNGNINPIDYMNLVWQKSVERILGLTLGNWVVITPFIYFDTGERSTSAHITLIKKFNNIKQFKRAKKRVTRLLDKIVDEKSIFFSRVKYSYIAQGDIRYLIYEFINEDDSVETNFPIFHKFQNNNKVIMTQSHLKLEMSGEQLLTIAIDREITRETIRAGKLEKIGTYRYI